VILPHALNINLYKKIQNDTSNILEFTLVLVNISLYIQKIGVGWGFDLFKVLSWSRYGQTLIMQISPHVQ
jgi:hypothetical protein